jgi:hypothetical protein
MSLVAALKGQLPVIQDSWGPVGQPGDVHQIKSSVDDFIRLCGQLVDWEDDLRAGLPPEEMRRLKDTMKGWTEGILFEMERLPKELLRPFEGGANPEGKISIELTLSSPPMGDFGAELEQLKKQNPLDIIF